MCRYVLKEYKSHFACFDCRKTFKKTPLRDWVKQKGLDAAYRQLSKAWKGDKMRELEEKFGTSHKQISEAYLNDVSACPQCGTSMAAMGLDFRAPKQSAIEQWWILESLYENGFAFTGCGCSIGYSPPTKRRDLDRFFAEHGRLSEGQKLLEKLDAAKK